MGCLLLTQAVALEESILTMITLHKLLNWNNLGSRSRFFIIRHIHNHTSIISSEMQVELKKNTAFT